MNTEPKRRLRVWWVVNPPADPKYHWVDSIEEAIQKINTLAKRDLKNSTVAMNECGLEIEKKHSPLDLLFEFEEWYDEDGFDIIQVIDGESEIYDENGRRRE